jgi:hypothetical protein
MKLNITILENRARIRLLVPAAKQIRERAIGTLALTHNALSSYIQFTQERFLS